MESKETLDINTQLNPGELEEPSLVFPELEDPVPTEVVKELSVTCAEKEECTLLLRPIEDGTEKSTSNKRDMPLLPHSLPPLLPLLFSPEDTEWWKFLNFPLLLTPLTSRPPKLSSQLSENSELEKNSREPEIPRKSDPDMENSETPDMS